MHMRVHAILSALEPRHVGTSAPTVRSAAAGSPAALDHRRELLERGYTIVPGVLTTAEVSHVGREAIDSDAT